MSAAGNDFILFDNRNAILTGREKDFFRQICQRRRAVGADGVILIERSSVADFKYRHFNSDGSLAEMCGNGARSVCYYAALKEIAPPHHTFEILSVIHEAWVIGTEVKLRMPPPVEIEAPVGVVTEEFLEEGGFIVLGVPHLVVFGENVADIDVEKYGRKYWGHPRFVNRTNVNFVQVCSSDRIRVRTFERGVEAETFSCGTGAVSSAILTHMAKGHSAPITVETKGGILCVDWVDYRQDVYLVGEAKIVYEGNLINPVMSQKE